MCSDHQSEEQVECNGVQSSNDTEEPVVADINNIEHPRDLVSGELQYTVADVDIIDTSDLQTTGNRSSHITKLDNFQEPLSTDIVVDKSVSQGEVGMYRVDTTDKAEKAVTTSLSNGHSSELAAHDESVVKVANGDIPALGRLVSKEFDVVLKLDTGEKRFGFSVIGGIDEGFPARVESIAGG